MTNKYNLALKDANKKVVTLCTRCVAKNHLGYAVDDVRVTTTACDCAGCTNRAVYQITIK